MTAKAWTRYTVNEGLSWPTENGGWWPVVGERTNSTAILSYIGNYGNCWSSSRHSIVYNAYHMAFNYTNKVYPSYAGNRSYGFPVRCIEGRRK